MIRLAGVAIAAAFAAQTAGASATAACPVRGVSGTGGYRLVHLDARGVSRTKARTVARLVVDQLRHQRGLDVPGVNAFAMSTHACPGCAATTSVSLGYPSGAKVTLSLKTAPSSSGTTV